MPHEMIIAMNVTDPATYAEYRKGMMPILATFGGGFRYDLVVSEVLRSAAPHPITRLFALYFRDRAAREAFFADPAYLQVRATFFDRSVNGYTVLAEHDHEVEPSATR